VYLGVISLYQQFFNFTTPPFSIAPDPHFIYMSEQHQEGLAHLLYGINYGGGFVVLTGEVGTGKTTLCQCLLKQLPDNIEIALVLNPKLNALELLATICDELQITYDQEKQSLKILVDSLNHYLLAVHAAGKRTVLVIDEAQNLDLNVLEQIRLLTNLETSTSKLLQIILIAQPELQQLLEKPELRQLNQRITARYHLNALSYSDTRKYIKHRLKRCGGKDNIFNSQAIKSIYKISKGVPRLINILSDRALLGAYVGNTQFVTVKIINKAAAEIFPSKKIAGSIIFFSSLMLMILVGLSFFLISKSLQTNKLVLTEPIVEKADLIKHMNRQKEDEIVEPLTFNDTLEKNNVTLTDTIPLLAQLWRKDLKLELGCEELEELGLSCLFDKSNWKDLIALNRPVIMEFKTQNTEKKYEILVGLEKGQPVFLSNKVRSFSLEHVINQWNGYYLMLWQPPAGMITEVSSGHVSEAVLWVKTHLDEDVSSKDNASLFDKSLKKAVMEFQKNKRLVADGIVGPRTFIHLINKDVRDNSPRLRGLN